jgi:hypothetical protein
MNGNILLPMADVVAGVVLFGEYRRSSKRTYVLLATMLGLFIVSSSLLSMLPARPWHVFDSSAFVLTQSPEAGGSFGPRKHGLVNTTDPIYSILYRGQSFSRQYFMYHTCRAVPCRAVPRPYIVPFSAWQSPPKKLTVWSLGEWQAGDVRLCDRCILQ